jgi:small subunit ribosomal protein S18
MAFFKPGAGKGRPKKRTKRVKRVEVPKPCRFEKDGTFEIDYRDIQTLGRYVSSQGKMSSAKRNGNSAFFQRQLALTVKRARFIGLLPYVGM